MPTTQPVLFAHLDRQGFEVHFDAHSSGSDGGPILLKACDRAIGLTDAFTASLWARANSVNPGIPSRTCCADASSGSPSATPAIVQPRV